MVKQFDDGMQARVQDKGETSEPFLVTNGVKEGCDLCYDRTESRVKFLEKVV